MEYTFQPSLPSFRSKMAAIEAMELSTIGFIVWGLLLLVPDSTTDNTLVDLILLLFILEGFLLGSWAIYISYIWISRIFPRRTDVRLRFFLAVVTSTYTFWTWIILDINRLVLSKLLYRGEAPVEYAWSWNSKQKRKNWEKRQKASQACSIA